MIGTLRTVVLDAPDARRLAAFYTALAAGAAVLKLGAPRCPPAG
jgi:hypothetical protein